MSWNYNTRKLLALKKNKFKQKDQPVVPPQALPEEEIQPETQPEPQPEIQVEEELEQESPWHNEEDAEEVPGASTVTPQVFEYPEQEASKEERPMELFGDGSEKNPRDVFVLMEKYKEANGGEPTQDICVLFSFWQANFGPDSKSEGLLNFHSKSFNNKSYFNQEKQSVSPRDEKEKVSPFKGELSPYQQSSLQRQQVDSILFSQKMKLDQMNEDNAIKLGDVKNQVLKSSQSKKGGNTNLSSLSLGSFINKEADRNQLSIDFMNITPIVEESEAFTHQLPEDQKLSEFKIDYFKSSPINQEGAHFKFNPDEQKDDQEVRQFSFEQDFNFNPPDKTLGESLDKGSDKSLENELDRFDNLAAIQNKAFTSSWSFKKKNKYSSSVVDQNFFINFFQAKTNLSPFQRMCLGSRSANYWASVPPSAYSWIEPSHFLVQQSIRSLCGPAAFVVQTGCHPQSLAAANFDRLRSKKQKIFNRSQELIQLSPNPINKVGARERGMQLQCYLSGDVRMKLLASSSLRCLGDSHSFIRSLVQTNGPQDLVKSLDTSIRTTHKKMLTRQNKVWSQKLLRAASPQEGFDALSSIGGDDHGDDADEGDVLAALQSQARKKDEESAKGDEKRSLLLKNDDIEYKQRELRNLQKKYRDRSQFSNKSDMASTAFQKAGVPRLDLNSKGDSNNYFEQHKTARKEGRTRSHIAGKEKSRSREHRPSRKSQNKHEGKSHKSRHKHRKKSKSRSKSIRGRSRGKGEFRQISGEGLDNTQDIQQLLEEIDNQKNQLDQQISKEEETFSKQFNHKLTEIEKALQNSRREGSVPDQGTDSYRGMDQRFSGTVDNFQYNQHHNSISSNSFNFNLQKQKASPFNLGVQNQGHSSSSSSSSSSAGSSMYEEEGKFINLQNVPHQVYTNNSHLLTDRGPVQKGYNLDLSKIRNTIEKIGGSRRYIKDSNDRQRSVVSGNSGQNSSFRQTLKKAQMNQSASLHIHKQGNNQTQQIGRQDIHRFLSGTQAGQSLDIPSSQSPTNTKLNTSKGLLDSSRIKGQLHKNTHSLILKNSTSKNGYRTMNFGPSQNASSYQMNPVLMKLQAQKSYGGQSSLHNSQSQIQKKSNRHQNLFQTQEWGALSQRGNYTTSISAAGATPKQKGPNQNKSASGQQILQGLATDPDHKNFTQSILSGTRRGDTQHLLQTSDEKDVKEFTMAGFPEGTLFSPKGETIDEESHLQSDPVISGEKQQQLSSTQKVRKTDRSELMGSEKVKQKTISIKLYKESAEKGLVEPGSQSSRIPNVKGVQIKPKGATLASAISQKKGLNISSSKMSEKQEPSGHDSEGQQRKMKMRPRTFGPAHQADPTPEKSFNSNAIGLLQPNNDPKQKLVPDLPLNRIQTQRAAQLPVSEKRDNLLSSKRRDRNQRAKPAVQSSQFGAMPADSLRLAQQPAATKQLTSGLKKPTDTKQGIKSRQAVQAQSRAQVAAMSSTMSATKRAKPQQQMQVPQESNKGALRLKPSQGEKMQEGRTSDKLNKSTKKQGKRIDSYQQIHAQRQGLKEDETVSMAQQQYYLASSTNISQITHQHTARQERTSLNVSSASAPYSLNIEEQIQINVKRLIELLLSDFLRKRNVNIEEVPPNNRLETLLQFWRSSLSKEKIIGKLLTKQASNANKTENPLSDKEKHLLSYLQGTDQVQLMKLNQDSITRKYGELAMLTEEQLLAFIQVHFGWMSPEQALKALEEQQAASSMISSPSCE